MIKKILSILFILLTFTGIIFAQETKMLTGSVTMVPQSFYGTWRVASKRIETNYSQGFKENGLDIWNLSRTGNVITLSNPFNGAKAEITVQKTDTNYVEFLKTSKNKQKVLNDRVELFIDGDKFKGFDTLELKTYVDGKIVKTQTAKYSLNGEKISGEIK